MTQKGFRRVIVATVVAIILLVLTLLNELGAQDTTNTLVDLPESVFKREVIGHTYHEGELVEIVVTTRVTAHIRLINNK